MNRKITTPLSVIGALSVAVLVTACSGGGGAPAGSPTDSAGSDWSSIEPVELTVSNIFAEGSVSTVLLQDWMDAVTEQTEGVVTFDYYPGGTLHPLLESLSALNSGLTDITYMGNSFFPDQLPISNWRDKVTQAALQSVNYPLVDVAGIGQEFAQHGSGSASVTEQAEAGFISFMPLLIGPPAFSCVEEFETPDDLAGRQTRVSGATAKGEVESLGMGGVFTAANEQYEALQRGVLDCAVNAPTTVVSGGLLEVTPWVAFPKFAPLLGSGWAISTSAWEELAPEIQDVMTEARYDAMTTWIQASLNEFQTLADAAEEIGGGVIESDEINPVVDDWWADQPSLESAAPTGVEDPQAEIAAINAVVEEWLTFSTEELGIDPEPENIRDVLAEGGGVVDDWQPWRDKLAEGPGIQ
ncbi:hypothetical protein LG299_06955 [Microbacterium lacus]|uniref:hypothetical protein n=1 Tax=Microbacterium lacus TaxID=415217 RepID=UPI0038514958